MRFAEVLPHLVAGFGIYMDADIRFAIIDGEISPRDITLEELESDQWHIDAAGAFTTKRYTVEAKVGTLRQQLMTVLPGEEDVTFARGTQLHEMSSSWVVVVKWVDGQMDLILDTGGTVPKSYFEMNDWYRVEATSTKVNVL